MFYFFLAGREPLTNRSVLNGGVRVRIRSQSSENAANSTQNRNGSAATNASSDVSVTSGTFRRESLPPLHEKYLPSSVLTQSFSSPSINYDLSHFEEADEPYLMLPLLHVSDPDPVYNSYRREERNLSLPQIGRVDFMCIESQAPALAAMHYPVHSFI